MRCDLKSSRPARLIKELLLHYKLAREQLILAVEKTSEILKVSETHKPMMGRQFQDNRILSIPHFHSLNKKQARQLLAQLCKDIEQTHVVSYLLEGEKDQIEKRYREIVHLNNAQHGSFHPMSFEKVVESVYKTEIDLKQERSKARQLHDVKTKMLQGETTLSVSEQFKQLIRSAKRSKKRSLSKTEGTSVAKDTSATPEGDSSPQESTPADNAIPDGIWRIAYSEQLRRLFFFNTETNIGQFSVPEEYKDSSILKLFDDAVVSPVSATPSTDMSVGVNFVYDSSHSKSIDYSFGTNHEEDAFAMSSFSETPCHTDLQKKRKNNSAVEGYNDDEVEILEEPTQKAFKAISWACETCTFLNVDSSSSSCAMCGTRNKQVAALQTLIQQLIFQVSRKNDRNRGGFFLVPDERSSNKPKIPRPFLKRR